MESSVWLLVFERLLSNEEAADQAFANGGIDLTAMKQLIAAMLAKQLHAIYEESGSGGE